MEPTNQISKEEIIERIRALSHFVESTGWQQISAMMKARQDMAFDTALTTKEQYVSSKCLGEMAVLRDFLDWPRRETEALRQQLDALKFT